MKWVRCLVRNRDRKFANHCCILNLLLSARTPNEILGFAGRSIPWRDLCAWQWQMEQHFISAPLSFVLSSVRSAHCEPFLLYFFIFSWVIVNLFVSRRDGRRYTRMRRQYFNNSFRSRLCFMYFRKLEYLLRKRVTLKLIYHFIIWQISVYLLFDVLVFVVSHLARSFRSLLYCAPLPPCNWMSFLCLVAVPRAY